MATIESLPGELQRFPRPETPMPKQADPRAALLTRVDAVFIGPRASERTIAGLLEGRFVSAITLYLKRPGAD